ncbi:unnamed protein product, partial [Mesorhabditis spiculigera]
MKPAELYLLAYNGLQVAGWALILVKTLSGLAEGLSWSQLYTNVECLVQIFQTAAVLEIVHCAIGLVRSPIATTIIQVFSRVSVVWPVLYKVHEARDSIGVPMLLVAWSITEVIRYSFYALNIVKSVPSFLVWCRYTFFIILYPMGASGELFTVVRSLNEVHAKKHFSLEMPNAINWSFSFWWYLVLFALTYIPGFPKMYLHMFGQRKKVLNDAHKKQN